MMNGDGGWGVGAWLMMSLVTLVVLALIVAGVVAFNRRSRSATAPAPGSGGSDALRTLDDRFARGEIDEAEYSKRRDLLKPS